VALRIVILGGPGAGKGTQARRIASQRAIPHISTGDILRLHLEQHTALGAQVKPYLDHGNLVPDALICEIVKVRLAEADCANGFVLDGFPRAMAQAEALADWMAAQGTHVAVALEIAVPDREIIDRLSARRTCHECGAIYNLKFKAPKDETRCDKCSGALVQREDDQESTIRERIRVYHETTTPLTRYYRDRGVLRTIECVGLSPDEVFEKVEEVLNSVGVA
jgi:adenylate kinase